MQHFESVTYANHTRLPIVTRNPKQPIRIVSLHPRCISTNHTFRVRVRLKIIVCLFVNCISNLILKIARIYLRIQLQLRCSSSLGEGQGWSLNPASSGKDSATPFVIKFYLNIFYVRLRYFFLLKINTSLQYISYLITIYIFRLIKASYRVHAVFNDTDFRIYSR